MSAPLEAPLMASEALRRRVDALYDICGLLFDAEMLMRALGALIIEYRDSNEIREDVAIELRRVCRVTGDYTRNAADQLFAISDEPVFSRGDAA